MCRAVVPRVGAGEREVTLTVNGKIPTCAGVEGGREGVERDPRRFGPKQCPKRLSLVQCLATTFNYGHIATVPTLSSSVRAQP